MTITQGGTYSGNWKSTDPNTPAVTVATTAPVVIQNSYVTGPNDLISDPYYGNNLTVKNVIGIGVNPNVRGQSNGIFVNAQNPSSARCGKLLLRKCAVWRLGTRLCGKSQRDPDDYDPE